MLHNIILMTFIINNITSWNLIWKVTVYKVTNQKVYFKISFKFKLYLSLSKAKFKKQMSGRLKL